jgi:hypothetical protein
MSSFASWRTVLLRDSLSTRSIKTQGREGERVEEWRTSLDGSRKVSLALDEARERGYCHSSLSSLSVNTCCIWIHPMAKVYQGLDRVIDMRLRCSADHNY